jgi:CheY-like chemotaxis protein
MPKHALITEKAFMNRLQTYAKANILLIDDNRDHLRLLAKLLRNEGYQTTQIARGKEAMASIQENTPDIIFLDISMPDMNGYQICRLLRSNERTKNIPIILISASDETIDRRLATSAGGSGYITKPLNIEEVLKQIETQLG